ncbi:hypothetical protein KQ304_11450 [Synechococcus sp. CS-1329]|nr:hypothetical protein [Synechococcus sp. CS-1329]MCT0219601.1 hypothetical protein [Synechococcus sp. CS-1329]
MDLFLWVLQGGGVSIALLGLGRERRMRSHRLGLVGPSTSPRRAAGP